jgi:hypothetical protein
MYRNPEHYPDPTAGAALCQLRRKENRLNTGKQFEADWKKSMPPDAWCYRLKDSAATYYGGNENLSFSVDNICDFDVYRYPMHHYFELKTIETPSIPLTKIFGSFDRDKQKYHKLKHITDMAAAASYKGQTAHVVINLPRQGEPHLCRARQRCAGVHADPDPQKYPVAVGRPQRH